MKFKDLEAGAMFRFVDSKITYTKISKGGYRSAGRFMACDMDRECVQMYLIPDSDIKEFSELGVGVTFRRLGDDEHFIKVNENTLCRVGGLTQSCTAELKCISVFEPKKLTFKDLPIKTRFQIAAGTFTKVSENTYCTILYHATNPEMEVAG